MNHENVAARVIELIGDRAEAHVNVFAGPSALTRFANSFIHQNVGEAQSAVMLTVAVDGRVATGTTSRMDDEGLSVMVEKALEAARLRPVDPDWPGVAPPQPIPDVRHWDEPTAAASPQDRAEIVKAFVDAGPDLRAAGFCSTDGDHLAFANTAGHRGAARRTVAVLDGIHQTDTSAGKAHQASGRLADLDGSAAGRLAARKALDSVDAIDLEPGRYEVILEPNAVATIAVFLAVYGLNARAVMEGRSFAQLDRRQFDPAFSLWDDALDDRTVGFPVDVEGTAKRRVTFIDEGVTKALAHDRRTAKKMGAESTGHAVPGGASWGAFPTDMFVGTGDRTYEELVGSVERGLLVTEFNYCRTLEPKQVVVTGLTRNGTFLIEDGRIVKAVSNLRFTQSFVEALGEGAVAGIESTSRYADSEFGPTMVIAPTMHLASWNFTGGAQG